MEPNLTTWWINMPRLYSGFPGVGKSHAFRVLSAKGFVIKDSDSSTFDKAHFPDNYIKHIKEVKQAKQADAVFISSHDVVRDALLDNQLAFTLVYPDINIKDEYLKRYLTRGSNEDFINLLNANWELWINQLVNYKSSLVTHVVLKSGETLLDVLEGNLE